MKKLHTIFGVLTLVVLLLGNMPVMSAQAAGVCYVKSNAAGGNTGTSWTNAYTNLQSALGASPCTEVWVAAGTYKPTATADRTQTFTLKNGVAIYGGFNGTETALAQRNWVTNVTILSGEIGAAGTADNSYHVVLSGLNTNSTAILDGFTVMYGNANGSADGGGGGMYTYSSSPTVSNVIFSGNSADNGGGMYNITGSTPTLTNVTFNGNSALTPGQGSGGGMYNYDSSPILTDVTFSGNSSIYGGGLRMELSTAHLTRVTFSGNTATSYGGGAYIDHSTPILTDVSFSGNSADWAGGVINAYSNSALTNVTFNANTVTSYGGAIFNLNSNPTLTNVTFSANTAPSGGASGGAIYNNNSSPTLTNVTFDGNSAGASDGAMFSWTGSNPVIKNSIVWGSGTQIRNAGTATSIINNSIVSGGCPLSATCTNVINSDPQLDPLANNGGFTQTMALRLGSPAIDAGNDATCPATDQRGTSRPQGAHCDMGAFERTVSVLGEPYVLSSTLANPNPTNAATVNFTVTFSESVTGVDATDFTLTTTGVVGATVTGVSGSGNIYTVTVNTGNGDGTVRLNVTDDDSIVDVALNPLGGVGAGNGNFTAGETYTVSKSIVHLEKNGGFESYTGTSKIPNSWKASTNFGSTNGKNTIHKSGKFSVKITGVGVLKKTLTQTLTGLTGSGGDAITFSFWVKGSSVPKTGRCTGQVLLYNGTTSVTTKTLTCPTGTYSFKKQSVTFVAPGAYTKITIRFTYNKSGGAVWLDVVNLVK